MRLSRVAAEPEAAAAPVRETELPAGERRQLTALFSDLVGSTEIASRLDPEDWHRISRDYQSAAAAAVSRFGGHVDKFLGDGLVCFFGVPQAHEDDAERAVRAGLAIVDAVQGLNRKAAAPSVRLQVRVGMHTGSAVVAHGGGESKDVFGDTPNIAARVQGVAEPDTVVITAATQRLVAGLFVVEERGAQQLKGVPEPVVLYRIVQASGVRSRLRDRWAGTRPSSGGSRSSGYSPTHGCAWWRGWDRQSSYKARRALGSHGFAISCASSSPPSHTRGSSAAAAPTRRGRRFGR